MHKLFTLGSEFEEKLHPEARKIIHEWMDNVERRVIIHEVNEDDLKFLSYDDKIRLKRINEVSECLDRCTDIKDGDTLHDSYFGDILFSRGIISQLKRDLLIIEFDIIPPLIKIYYGRLAEAAEKERKRLKEEKIKEIKIEEEQKILEAKAEAERKEKEDSERWCDAYIAIEPPDDDAKKYLNDEEYENFERATCEAVTIYMEKGERYLDDLRTFDYRQYLCIINSRKEREQQEINASKEQERQQNAAIHVATEFNSSLNKYISGLKSKLSNKPRDLKNYFTAEIQDKRYTGYNFDAILDDGQKQVFDANLVRVANDKLTKIIPLDLLEFIIFPSTYYRLYFPLPLIEKYRNEDVPCLDFYFDIFAAAYGQVILKLKEKNFGRYKFYLPIEMEGDLLAHTEESRLLGYFYVFLNPEELGGYVPLKTIPLVLLNWLLKGGEKPAGVTISAASDGIITYKITNFKEEVAIPVEFADCLKNIGDFSKFVNMGWMSGIIANIVKNQLGELNVEQPGSFQKDKIERKDTGKAMVFRLFDDGKRPSDREVKATKIKPQILYRYYQEWKKLSTNKI